MRGVSSAALETRRVKSSGVGEWRPNALGERLFENTYGLQRLGKGLPVLPMDDSQTKKNYDVVMVQ